MTSFANRVTILPSRAALRRVCIAAAMLAIAIPPALGADDSSYIPVAPLPLGSNILNLPSPGVMSRGTWEVRFTHRFAEPINRGDVHSFWGLDGGADVGIGLTFVPVRDLELALFRSTVQDDVELGAKYRILSQAPAVPASLSVRGGVDWRTERNVKDRLSGFAQAIVSRQFGRKLALFAVPTAATNAGQFDSAFNVPVGAAWFLKPYLSVVAEVIPPNSDLPDNVARKFGWTVGLKRAIGGHYFEVVLTDTTATHVDQYMGGLSGIRSGDVHLGFNIERRFGSAR